MNKKEYTVPEIEFIIFETEDILLASTELEPDPWSLMDSEVE